MNIDAVTFDFWNTLVADGGGAARDQRIDAWLGILEDAGFATERQHLDKAMASSWERFLGSWKANEQYTHVEAAIDIVESLGYELPEGVHEALLSSYTYATTNTPSLTEGIGDCLRALASAGVRLGIICDVGMTPSTALREILAHHGLLSLFDHWSFSDEVGHYKPSAAIFEHALAGLGGVAPDRAAHVGDLRRTDVAGALGFGMTAVRYTGAFDDVEGEGPDATFVIASHADLPGLLGIS
ncbi:MAG TPA: HAD family hydrolase [Acidimicrobiales bacterium]|nr:HAD family hydrolase [Acidimicrobiales bacterium]